MALVPEPLFFTLPTLCLELTADGTSTRLNTVKDTLKSRSNPLSELSLSRTVDHSDSVKIKTVPTIFASLLLVCDTLSTTECSSL